MMVIASTYRPSTMRRPEAHRQLRPAWIAAIGFTLQIYFDFSGHSDMALAGPLLRHPAPANFDSLLKATSIIDSSCAGT
jgi:D-alanyl-lipoteichoic acid acyltransferase DltB (MBOAT superfamily)